MELNFNKLNNISSEGLSQRETHADAHTDVLNKSTLCTTHLTENATERNTDAQKKFAFDYALRNDKREAGLISIYAQLRNRHINLIRAVFNNRALFSEDEYASFTEDYDRCVDDFYNTFMLYHLQRIEKKDFSQRLKEKLKNNAFKKHIDEMLRAVNHEIQNNTNKFINCCEYMIYRSIFPPVAPPSDEEADKGKKVGLGSAGSDDAREETPEPAPAEETENPFDVDVAESKGSGKDAAESASSSVSESAEEIRAEIDLVLQKMKGSSIEAIALSYAANYKETNNINELKAFLEKVEAVSKLH